MVILWEIRERRRPLDGDTGYSFLNKARTRFFAGETNKQVLHHLASTGRALPVAKNPCPLGYEDLGQKCISYEPERRPSFRRKTSSLLKVTLLNNYILEISYSLQDIGTKLNESGKLDCRLVDMYEVLLALGYDSVRMTSLAVTDAVGGNKKNIFVGFLYSRLSVDDVDGASLAVDQLSINDKKGQGKEDVLLVKLTENDFSMAFVSN